MIVIIRCNDIVSDSRAMKYIDFYERKGLDYRIIAWDRTGSGAQVKNAIFCPYKTEYNKGGYSAVKGRMVWMKFVYDTLKSLNADLRIHACDLDAAYPAIIYKKYSKYKNYVLFDVFDWFSDTLYDENNLILAAFRYMEKQCVKYSDHIVICEEERVRQIPYDINAKYSVLPNIPSFASGDFLMKNDDYTFDNDKVTLSYVGGLAEHRCLDLLIQGAKEQLYNLLIAGFGDATMENDLEACNAYENIRYFGKVKYQDGLNIEFNSDIIYAMYSKVNPNHFFAAPNKYYEAMFLGKPIITTAGIITAEKVAKNQMGYCMEESYDALKALITGINREQIATMGKNAKTQWRGIKTSVEDYLQGLYTDVFVEGKVNVEPCRTDSLSH